MKSIKTFQESHREGLIMKLSLVDSDDPVLSKKAEDFDFDHTNIYDPKQLFEDMRDLMCAKRGIGLAAPQCGIPLNVFVMGSPSEPDSVISVFNPKIIDVIGEEVYYDEGCLSFPGLFIRIKRNSAIRVRYTTYSNITDTIKFDGMTARVFLHEYDHLQGTLYTDIAKAYHLERAKRKQKIYMRQRKQNALSKK